MFLVMGSGSVYPVPPVPVKASIERSKAFISVMSKLMPKMPTGLPSSLRIKIVEDLSSLPSVVLVRYGSRSCTSVVPSCMDSNTIWLGPSPNLRPLT